MCRALSRHHSTSLPPVTEIEFQIMIYVSGQWKHTCTHHGCSHLNRAPHWYSCRPIAACYCWLKQMSQTLRVWLWDQIEKTQHVLKCSLVGQSRKHALTTRIAALTVSMCAHTGFPVTRLQTVHAWRQRLHMTYIAVECIHSNHTQGCGAVGITVGSMTAWGGWWRVGHTTKATIANALTR